MTPPFQQIQFKNQDKTERIIDQLQSDKTNAHIAKASSVIIRWHIGDCSKWIKTISQSCVLVLSSFDVLSWKHVSNAYLTDNQYRQISFFSLTLQNINHNPHSFSVPNNNSHGLKTFPTLLKLEPNTQTCDWTRNNPSTHNPTNIRSQIPSPFPTFILIKNRKPFKHTVLRLCAVRRSTYRPKPTSSSSFWNEHQLTPSDLISMHDLD